MVFRMYYSDFFIGTNRPSMLLKENNVQMNVPRPYLIRVYNFGPSTLLALYTPMQLNHRYIPDANPRANREYFLVF